MLLRAADFNLPVPVHLLAKNPCTSTSAQGLALWVSKLKMPAKKCSQLAAASKAAASRFKTITWFLPDRASQYGLPVSLAFQTAAHHSCVRGDSTHEVPIDTALFVVSLCHRRAHTVTKTWALWLSKCLATFYRPRPCRNCLVVRLLLEDAAPFCRLSRVFPPQAGLFSKPVVRRCSPIGAQASPGFVLCLYPFWRSNEFHAAQILDSSLVSFHCKTP